jgi:hypothetical protein
MNYTSVGAIYTSRLKHSTSAKSSVMYLIISPSWDAFQIRVDVEFVIYHQFPE